MGSIYFVPRVVLRIAGTDITSKNTGFCGSVQKKHLTLRVREGFSVEVTRKLRPKVQSGKGEDEGKKTLGEGPAGGKDYGQGSPVCFKGEKKW